MLSTGTKPGFFKRLWGAVTFRGWRGKVKSWYIRCTKVNTFELQGDEIVSGGGWRPVNRVRLDAIKAWKLYLEMGFDVVTLDLIDGISMNWLDYHNDLIGILESKVPERRVEWEAV